MDTVCSLQYKPGVLLTQSFILFLQFSNTVVSAQLGNLQNFGSCLKPALSILLFQFLNHREISKILLKATHNNHNFDYFPHVNHFIFRTEAKGKILLIAPLTLQGFKQ